MPKKFYTAKYDRVFKALFCNEDDTYLLKEFLTRLLDKEIKHINFLNNELLINNVSSKNKTVDLLAVADDMYVHIEVNTSRDKKYFHIRNFTYFTEIYNKKTLKGEDYKFEENFIHIDLSYNLSNKENIVNTYYLVDENKNKYIENFEIREYNMDKIKKFWYDLDIENINKYLHLIILDLERNELEKLLKLDISERDEKFVYTYYEKTKDLNDDEYYTSQISREEDLWRCANTEKKIAREEGIEQGIEQGMELGIEQERLSTIKNMLDKGFSETEIKDILNLDDEKFSILKSQI